MTTPLRFTFADQILPGPAYWEYQAYDAAGVEAGYGVVWSMFKSKAEELALKYAQETFPKAVRVKVKLQKGRAK